jgi:soluble lytic murein transglycosylase-like protein
LGLLLALIPATASADLVTFRGGRVLKVASIRFEGDVAVLVLRSGGQMEMARDFVVSVVPDEVPFPEPVAPPIAAPEVVAPAAPTTRDALLALVDVVAARHGVSARLAHAVIRVESNYQADAVSNKGAMGLMQLMPATARHYSLDDPFDPEQNLDAGLRHLRGLLDRYGKGQESLALAAYNAGEGAVSRYRGIPPYRETQDYVRKILQLTGR